MLVFAREVTYNLSTDLEPLHALNIQNANTVREAI